MKKNAIFILAALGILAGVIAAYLFGIERKAQPPVFAPVSNPYQSAIYANGIIESDQAGGSNINIYPEVSGLVKTVLVHEGQKVSAGTTLIGINDSVQEASTEQLRLQAEAALALLQELQTAPRKETLAIASSQVTLAQANLKITQDQYDKRHASYEADAKSISKDILDTADNAVRQAAAALEVARRQYDLTRAGSWSYDIVNQRRQYEALQQGYLAARALSLKYTVKAEVDGVVLAVNTTVGSYASSSGSYNPYTQALDPLVIMSAPQDSMVVRCYIDEILITRLPAAEHIQAQMSIRGSQVKVPLEFVRVQPFVSPKIELSNQRQEKVDLRVLPVLFRFKMTSSTMAYPGQLVDVFIGSK